MKMYRTSGASRALLLGLLYGLVFGGSPVHGEMVYVDAIDGVYHPSHTSPNTFNALTGSPTDWVTTVDSTAEWRFRNSGPGAVSFGASAYQGRVAEGDGPIYTTIGGLSPGTAYAGLRLYFVISQNTSDWLIQYSLDGTNWSAAINRDTPGVVKLVDSTTDALGTIEMGSAVADTRCYFPIPGTLTADTNGEIRFYVRSPTETTDRTVYDGFAFEGLTIVRATSPQPADHSTIDDPSSVTSLSWMNSETPDTVTNSVYFGDEDDYDPLGPNHFGLPLVQTNVTAESIPIPQTLSSNATYYWIVDCADSQGGTVPGDLWRFYTSGAEDGTLPAYVRDQLGYYSARWQTPGTGSADSMPLGNGDITLNVWVEDNGDLLFYVGKSDAWSEATRLLKLGRVRVSLAPNPFVTGQPFVQMLNLHEGRIDISAGQTGERMTLHLWVDANHPVARVECSGEQPFTMQVALETWRNSTVPMNPTTYHSYKGIYDSPVTPTEEADVVLSRSDNLAWYHRNESSFYQVTLDNQHLSGFESTYPDPYMNLTFGGRIDGPGLVKVDDKTLETPSSVTNARFNVHALTAQTETVAEWESALDTVAAGSSAVDWDTAKTAHAEWWDGFWSRSWIFVDGDTDAERVTRAWLLQRFMMACQSRGAYPVEHNGGTFTFDYNGFDSDYRRWGPCYWHQNTRLFYWPLLASGDTDLLQPFFRMYLNALPLQRDVTQLYWGHGGAFFPETMNFYGLYNNDNFGWGNTGYVTENGYIRNHHQGALEVLMNMLDYYDYVQDEAFLTDSVVPYAAEVIRFFDQHWPRENGVIKFYPINALETYWDCTNPMDAIAGLKATITRLLALDTNLTTQALRDEWQNCLDDLPPIPTGTSVNNLPCLKPAQTYGGTHNGENVALWAVFPYRLYGPGRPDLERAVETYWTRPFKSDQTSWPHDSVHAAALGLADEAKARLMGKLNACEGAVRFPAFWRVGDWMPDVQAGGVMAITLQDMLLQRNGSELLALPAWPSGWDVSFRLHAPSRRTVECTYANGGFQEIDVTQTSSNLTIAAGETLSLPFTLVSYADGSSTGQLVSASSSLQVAGDLVNDGMLRLIGDAGLNVSGTFTNNGVLDIMTWNGSLPGGFVNNGTVLDRSAIKVDSAETAGSDFEATIYGYAGHRYQLQYRNDLLNGSWENVGAPVAGADALITLTHPSGANAPIRLYRVAVDP